MAAFGLSAQPEGGAPPLSVPLRAVQNSGADRVLVSKQFVDSLMALAHEPRLPSRSSVQRFAERFTEAVLGKRLSDAQTDGLQRCITDMVRGRVANFESAGRLNSILTSIRVDPSKAQAVVDAFLEIGKDVRGPDDSPLLKFRFR
jgi:hypothetical protein